MFKKIFVAMILSLISVIAIQSNICGAISPNEIYLGGLTYGSKIDEMKRLHGEPDAIFFGVEGYETCEYADGATIMYNKFSGQIKSIDVTGDTLNWRGDKRIGVGMYYDEWLEWHDSPDVVKKGDEKTVYLYFHYKSDPVEHITFRDYGLFIAFNTKSGIITEMKIYGDSDFATFEESYENVMDDMLISIKN